MQFNKEELMGGDQRKRKVRLAKEIREEEEMVWLMMMVSLD